MWTYPAFGVAEYRPEATSQVPGSTAANVVEYTAQTVEGVQDFTSHLRSKLSTILSWCTSSASYGFAHDFCFMCIMWQSPRYLSIL